MTSNSEMGTRPEPRDVLAALGLLSRLPIRIDGEWASARGAAAVWAYPVAGLVIGLLAVGVAGLALVIGLPAPIAACLALIASVIVTGAMHEDGLADTADGLWGGWERDRRLDIMKDSRIGVYGVAALVMSLLLRWTLLTAFLGQGGWLPALIAAAILSRAAMTLPMYALRHARDTGLSHQVGRPPRDTVLLGCGFAVLMSFGLCGWAGLLALVSVFVATLLCMVVARAKIGGQTGDILGATQQVTEITALLALLAVTGS